MMIVTTDAIVLKAMKYGETSKIVTLYTRDFGRLSVLAKGARARNKRFGSSLEPLSCVSAVFYKKEHRDLHLLTQCTVRTPLRRIPEDLEKLAAAMALVELVLGVAHQEEKNEEMFALLCSTLAAIDIATKNVGNALYFFEVRLFDILGFKPNFHACLRCSRPLEEISTGVSIEILHGGVICDGCSAMPRPGRSISAPALKVLQRLQVLAEPGLSSTISLHAGLREELADFLDAYLRNHVEGLRPSKSGKVFSEISKQRIHLHN